MTNNEFYFLELPWEIQAIIFEKIGNHFTRKFINSLMPFDKQFPYTYLDIIRYSFQQKYRPRKVSVIDNYAQIELDLDVDSFMHIKKNISPQKDDDYYDIICEVVKHRRSVVRHHIIYNFNYCETRDTQN
jgi:hypothetical protein